MKIWENNHRDFHLACGHWRNHDASRREASEMTIDDEKVDTVKTSNSRRTWTKALSR